MKRYFGCHVSVAGGLENAALAARELSINTIQIHPSPPQRWNTKPFAADYERLFLEQRAGSELEKVFFHGIYLINMASPDAQKFHMAKVSLVNYLDLLTRLQGDGVIFHVGSMKDQSDVDQGYERVIEGINWVLEHAPGQSRLILEVAAGSGMVIGSRLEELARIFDGVEQKNRLGFGLDSQHMWASGYDFKNKLEGIVADVDRVFGLDKVWAIHLNDSKTELGSRKDRHENLGEGLIGEAALKSLFNHEKLSHIPFILETPALKELAGAASEIAKLKGYLA